jgi:nicotinate-nucleotide adenylyltransferase
MNAGQNRIRLPREVETLAVFGGTFDPIHIAHLIVAEEIVDQGVAERVLFVPAYIPPHKANEPVTPANHRLAMVRLAIRGNRRFSVSDIEIRKGGRSYTIDTLRMLRDSVRPNVRIAPVVGADQVQEFETWKDHRMLAEEFPLILTTRAGYPEDLRKGLPCLGSARTVRIPDLEISATEIRRRIASGKSIRYLVPRPVEAYIRQHRLYGAFA